MKIAGYEINLNNIISIVIGIACVFVGLWILGVPLLIIAFLSIRKRNKKLKKKELKKLNQKAGD